jgi:hypothetical protein
MSKRNKIILIIAAIIAIAAIIYFYVIPPAEEEITEDGITYYPDGSYSYQIQYESGQISQVTVSADGYTTVTTIQQGTHEQQPIDIFSLPIYQNLEGGTGLNGIALNPDLL